MLLFIKKYNINNRESYGKDLFYVSQIVCGLYNRFNAVFKQKPTQTNDKIEPRITHDRQILFVVDIKYTEKQTKKLTANYNISPSRNHVHGPVVQR